MISKSTLKEIANRLGIKQSDLTAAIEAEAETDITIPEGEYFTPSQLQQRDNAKYNDGKQAGEEMAVKELKTSNSLEFTGKTVKSLFEHLQTAKKPEDGETVNKLRTTISELEKEKTSLSDALSQVKKDSKLLSMMPPVNNGMSVNESIAIWRANGYDIQEDNGKFVLTKDGNVVKDKTENPVDPKAEITSFFTEKGLMGEQSGGADGKRGRGGKGTPPKGGGVSKSSKDIEKKYLEEHDGASLLGHEYSAYYQKEIEAAKEAGYEIVD